MKKKNRRVTAACMQGMRRGVHAGCRIACSEGKDENCHRAGERAKKSCRNFQKLGNQLYRLCFETYVAVAVDECRGSAAHYAALEVGADAELAATSPPGDGDDAARLAAELLEEEAMWLRLHPEDGAGATA